MKPDEIRLTGATRYVAMFILIVLSPALFLIHKGLRLAGRNGFTKHDDEEASFEFRIGRESFEKSN